MTAHCKLALIYVNGPRIESLGSRFPKQLMSRLCAKSGHSADHLVGTGAPTTERCLWAVLGWRTIYFLNYS
jgi:hypothetical protein